MVHEQITAQFLTADSVKKLRLIEKAASSPADELFFELYRDMAHPDDWYVLIEAASEFFLSDLAHVVDVVEETLMVTGTAWYTSDASATQLPLDTKTNSIILQPNTQVAFALLKATTDSPSLLSK